MTQHTSASIKSISNLIDSRYCSDNLRIYPYHRGFQQLQKSAKQFENQQQQTVCDQAGLSTRSYGVDITEIKTRIIRQKVSNVIHLKELFPAREDLLKTGAYQLSYSKTQK